MKKALLLLIVTLVGISMVATFSLAGCKGEAVTETTAEETTAEETTSELVVLRFGVSSDNLVRMKASADAYMELNPNVTIIIEINPANYQAIAPTLFGSEDAPDVSWYWHSSSNIYDKMAESGILVNLDDVIIPEMENALPPSLIKEYKRDGHYYYMPWDTQYFPVIYYSKAIFEEAGIEAPDGFYPTLDEFFEMAEKIKAAGYEAMSQGYIDTWILSQTTQAILSNALPDEIYDDLLNDWKPGYTPKYSWTDPEVVAAMELVKRICTEVVSEESFSRAYFEGRAAFLQGKTGMHQDGCWAAATINSEAPEGFEYGWFYFPKIGENAPMILTASSAFIIPSGGKHVEESKKFVKFCTTKERQLLDVAMNGGIPARNDISQNEIMEALGYPVGDIYRYAVENGSRFPWMGIVPADYMVESFTWNAEMVTGLKTVEEVCQLYEDYAQDLREQTE